MTDAIWRRSRVGETTLSAGLPETGETPNAQVTLAVDGIERNATATGGGPVDAAFRAIEHILETGTDLLLYSVNNITSGTDSQGEVTVRLLKAGGLSTVRVPIPTLSSPRLKPM